MSGRGRPGGRMALALQVATAVVLGLALLSLVAPAPVGRTAAAAAVTALVATPLLRVAWLGARWWREGDRVFTLAAGALLAVVALGAGLALVAR